MEAQPGFRPQPDYARADKPDQAEGKRILEEFRGLGLSGNYYLEVQLRVLPRRGEERLYTGRLWGGRTETGNVTRISLAIDGGEHRLFVQDGSEPVVWQWRSGPGATVEKLDLTALFVPLAQTDLTLFDLQRPYLAWTDFAYEGITKVRGRPAYQFLLYPPREFAAKYPALTGVRMYLDSQFKFPVQSEQIGERGKILKSMTVLDGVKVDEQWLPRAIDLRDETTRNKTRFIVTGAALKQDFVGATFTGEGLSENLSPPAADRIKQIAP